LKKAIFSVLLRHAHERYSIAPVFKIGMYNSTDDETPQLLECLRVMSSRRAALEQQREDIEAMLAEISQFQSLCQQELTRRDNA
jgi:uncharacterized protein YqcC (DUF446 family)